MLNPKMLRTELDEVARQLGRRALTIDRDWFTAREQKRKQLQTDAEQLQNQRNTNSKLIAQGKSSGQDVSDIMDEMGAINAKLKACEGELERLQSEIHAWMLTLPNLPHESVPDGNTEADNAVVRTWGEPPEFDFPPLGHEEIGKRTEGLDFGKSAKIAGSRFVTMQGQVARLHRALIQFMLDVHVSEHGYREVYVPYIANDESLTCTGQLPKFEADLFKLSTDSRYHRERGRAACQVRLPHALFSFGGRLVRQGHAGHDSPAPVRKGRARAARQTRSLLACARGTHAAC